MSPEQFRKQRAKRNRLGGVADSGVWCSAAVIVRSLETNRCASDGGSPGKSGVTAHTRTRQAVRGRFSFLLIFLLLFTSSIPAAQRAPGSMGHAVSWSYAVSMVPLLLRKTASLSSVLFDHQPRIHVAVCCCCARGRCSAGAGVTVSVRGDTKAVSVAGHRCQSVRP